MSNNLTVDNILNILTTEKCWCEENIETITELDRQYKVGFIKGLKQAIYLIEEAKRESEEQDG